MVGKGGAKVGGGEDAAALEVGRVVRLRRLGRGGGRLASDGAVGSSAHQLEGKGDNMRLGGVQMEDRGREAQARRPREATRLLSLETNAHRVLIGARAQPVLRRIREHRAARGEPFGARWAGGRPRCKRDGCKE